MWNVVLGMVYDSRLLYGEENMYFFTISFQLSLLNSSQPSTAYYRLVYWVCWLRILEVQSFHGTDCSCTLTL